MAGPQPGEYGGIASTVATLLHSPKLARCCEVSYLSTWRWGSAFTKFLAFFLALAHFVFWIAFKRVDVVHLHMAYGPSFYRKAFLALFARGFGKPYVVQLHSSRLVELTQRSAFHERMVRSVLNRARAVLVLHERAEENVQKLTDNRTIFVLPNPVNVRADQPFSVREDVDAKQDQERVNVLFLGDISPEKGVWDLLRAFPSVIDHCEYNGTPVKLIFCGRGQIGEAKRRCEKLGISAFVEFHGTVTGEKKTQILQQADIFTLPSYSEELPVALLEAMAYGLPAVATRTGGIPEAIEHEKTGLLIPIGDAERLAEALVQLIENPRLRQEMGKKGWQRVQAKFDCDLIVERLVSIYELILQRERTRRKGRSKSMNIRPTVKRERDKASFLGYALANLSMDEVLSQIGQFIREGKPRTIFGLNAALFVWSLSDVQLQGIYQSCDLLMADSMGIYYAARLLNQPVREAVSAVSLLFRLMEEASVKGYRVYLLGAREEVINRAVENLQAEHPVLNIVGSHHGYFNLKDEGEVVASIRKAKPDILFVGMSTPLKERFISRNLEKMEVPVCIGVGGSFDIAAGLYKRAPSWVIKLCLEWLYRLIQEPGRLGKRYTVTNAIFIYVVLRAIMRRLLGLPR